MNRKEILETADKCVNGHREQDYGSPEDNFSKIANLWTAYKGFDFDSIDVAMMLALLKIARAKSGNGTDDCFVDLAGYAACAGEIFDREQKMRKDLAELCNDEISYDCYDTLIKDEKLGAE